MRILTSILTLTALGATLVPAAVFAQDVPYVQMSVCDRTPYKSLRDYWDQTKTFCYVRNGQEIKVPLSGMGEIKLREDGKSVPGPYYDALSTENKDVVGQYTTYYVRYLAVENAAPAASRDFVVHVFFNWGGSTQTIFAFGKMDAKGQARLTGFASSKGIENTYRATYNTLTNLFSVFRGQNPGRVGDEQSQAKDRQRIAPAADVVTHYQSQLDPIKEILLP